MSHDRNNETGNPVEGDSKFYGYGETTLKRPVNEVSPMAVHTPEEKTLNEGDRVHVIQEETSPGKGAFSIEDLFLKEVIKESSPLAVKISQMLNRDNSRVIRNWRHLAESFGVSSDVCLSFTCDQEHSPTDDLFSHLESWNPDMTIKELKTALRSMSRNDLVKYLESKGIPDGDRISDEDRVSDRLEIVDTFKEKLDIQSRTLSWIKLATKCGIPKKVYMKFGKPKLGPTSQMFLHIRLSDSLLTIRDLKRHLKDMERCDVLRVLEQHKVKDDALVREVFKPETQLMDETSELLDKDLRSTSNWRNLASRLNIANHEYENFDTSKVNNRNPTMLLLGFLKASQPNLKASEFIRHLKKIQRNDVVEELQKELPAAFERLKPQDKPEEDNQTVVTISGSQFHNSTVVSDGACPNRSVSVDLPNKEQRWDLLVTQLPLSIYGTVCAMLDAEDPFFRDHRMLAEQLGMSKQLMKSLSERKKYQPTHALLVEYKLSIRKFMEILKNIKREDVMEVLEAWLQ